MPAWAWILIVLVIAAAGFGVYYVETQKSVLDEVAGLVPSVLELLA